MDISVSVWSYKKHPFMASQFSSLFVTSNPEHFVIAKNKVKKCDAC